MLTGIFNQIHDRLYVQCACAFIYTYINMIVGLTKSSNVALVD